MSYTSRTLWRITNNRDAFLTIALIVLASCALLAIGFGGYFGYQLVNRHTTVVDEIRQVKESQHKETQFLISRISYGEERQRVLLFLRDEILAHWSSIPHYKKNATLDRAFELASTNVTVSEIFPAVDVLLMAATQFVESSWGVYRLSPAGAIGLNQIMPSTGVLLSRVMGREFYIEMLNDDRISTEMAAKYLDLMYVLYKDWGVALADYNGGPYSARYFRDGDPRLSEETANYVPAVLAKYKELQEKLASYNMHASIITQQPEVTP